MNPAAARLLARASALGAHAAEVFLSSGTEFSVKVFNREIDSLVSAQSRGVGLRTLRDQRVGFAYTFDLGPESLDALVDEALRNGRYNHADEANALPPVAAAEPIPGLYAPDLDRVDPQRKIQFALDLERLATSTDPRVKRVSDVIYSDGSGHVELANSLGLDVTFDRTVAYASVDAIAEQESEMQSGYAFTYGRDLDALQLDATAQEAAQRAAGLLGACPAGPSMGRESHRAATSWSLPACSRDTCTTPTPPGAAGRPLPAARCGRTRASPRWASAT
jgi:PmbA protein